MNATTQPRYVCEYGVRGAIKGMNTVEDLAKYLSTDPHPAYRLASCVRQSGDWLLVWEII
jgi:hypothetical protein